jgi:hypothetical protein
MQVRPQQQNAPAGKRAVRHLHSEHDGAVGGQETDGAHHVQAHVPAARCLSTCTGGAEEKYSAAHLNSKRLNHSTMGSAVLMTTAIPNPIDHLRLASARSAHRRAAAATHPTQAGDECVTIVAVSPQPSA